MDPSQFDDLVARIAGLTRRDAFKGLSVGALTSAGIGGALAESADAAEKGRGDGKRGRGNKGRGNNGRDNNAGAEGKGKNNKNKAKKCKNGKKHCGNKKKCFDLQTNSKHCGNCGTSCATGEFCSGGICLSGT